MLYSRTYGEIWDTHRIAGAQIDDITFYDYLEPDLARIMDRSDIAFADCMAANIEPRASFHILRHTYGSSLTMNRVPLQVIAAALGHADTRITERHYAHLLPSFVADQIGANLPRLGIDIENIRQLKVGRKITKVSPKVAT